MTVLLQPETITSPAKTESEGKSPLLLEGLVEFNQAKWGLTAHRVQWSPEDSGLPNIESVYYTDGRGRIEHPRIGTYIPVAFNPTPTESRSRLGRQWLAVAELLASDMHERGLAGAVSLAPEVADVRPWQWEGFQADVRYTYCLDFPYDSGEADSSVRRQIAKGSRNGFRVERVSRMEDVDSCLSETQGRKDFQVGLAADDLAMAREFVGDESFRAYVCYSAEGEPACGGIMLHNPGARALYWVFGTKTKFMQAGATQFAIQHILDDLHASGATGIDFLGAQIPSVAAMKATWGSRLVPYYRVDGGRLRAIGKHARDYLSFRRSG